MEATEQTIVSKKISETVKKTLSWLLKRHPIHSLVREEIKNSLKRIKRGLSLNRWCKVISRVLEDLDSEGTVFSRPRIYSSMIMLHWYSPSKRQLLEFLRLMGKSGFRRTFREEHADSKYVEYNFTPGPVDLTVWYTSDSASCRYVKVGTKTVDVLELQCDEEKI